MTEVLSKRTAHQKVYDDPAGENQYRAEVHASEVHYLDNADAWRDVDGLMDGATFKSKDKRVQFGIVNGYMGAWVPGRHLGFRPWKMAFLDSADGRTRVIADANYGNATLNGNLGTIHNVFPGSIDLQAQFTPRQMRKRFLIPSKPSLPDPTVYGMEPTTTYLVFGYEVDNTSGLMFHRGDTDEPFPLNELVYADVVMKGDQGVERLRLLRGQAVESGLLMRATFPVYYIKTAQIPFGEAIAYTSVQDAEYPLIVDPSSTVYSGTEDGEIKNATTVDTTSDRAGVGGYLGDAFRYYCRFDLSGIGATDTCDTATLDIYPRQKAGSNTITPKIYTTDWGATLTSGDHGQAGIAQTGKTLASLTMDQYNSWDLTEADVAAKFGGYCSFELQGSSETGDNVLEVQTADYATTSRDPKMTIDYTEAGGRRRWWGPG